MPPLRWTVLSTLTLLAVLGYLYLPLSAPRLTSPGITHVVLFKWKDSVGQGPIADATARMLSLRTRCTHPVRKTPYIRSLKGGRDNSPEGLQDGLTHVFVAEFDTPWERDYYVRDDPDHRAFVESIGDVVDKVVVVDFEPGNFGSRS